MNGQTGVIETKENVEEKQSNDVGVRQPIQQPIQPQVPILGGIPSKKMMREMMMPRVGDRFGEYTVIYVNSGQFRFTATGNNLPAEGALFESDGRLYQVERVGNGRFNASFKGFKQNPIVEAPIENDENLAKVI